MTITFPTEKRPHILKRAYYKLIGSYSVQQKVRQQLIEVIRHFRYNQRPSLVGKIPGLTPALEEILRSGTVEIFECPNEGYKMYIKPKGIGNTEATFFLYPLSSFTDLLPDKSKKGERTVYLAAKKWSEDQSVYPGANISSAKRTFENKIQQPYGIITRGKCSPGTRYMLTDILNLLPERILRSRVLKHIHLNRSDSYFGNFNKGHLGITSSIDRYLFAGFLLHELGHVIEHFLVREGKQSEIDRLRKKFLEAGAVFVTNYLHHNKKERKFYVSGKSEFIAENFFHFIIFGKEMLKGPPQELRRELYRLYAGLYKNPQFDALDQLAI
jgi:hypothetical protein